MAGNPTPDKTVYDLFKDELSVLGEAHQQLHTASNPKINPASSKPAQKQLYRGAFIAYMVLWEGYAQDVLIEGFLRLRDCMCKLSLDVLLRNDCRRKLLKDALQKAETNIELVNEPGLWKDILLKHTKEPSNVSPIFYHQKGIDKSFKQVFGVNEDVSDTMTKVPIEIPCTVYFSKGQEPVRAPVLRMKNTAALSCVSHLYYGARCILAHGRKEPTLREKGVLHEFPSSNVSLQGILKNTDKKAVEELLYLYECIIEGGRNSSISFAHLVTLERYLAMVASRLYNAVGKLVSDHYGVTIWDNVQEPSFPTEHISS